jgi:hypothetical protein
MFINLGKVIETLKTNICIMKKIALLLTLAIVFISCEGPAGPLGLPGFNGEDGVNIVAQSYEFTTSFSAPDYETQSIYPNSIEVFPTDMTLVYILWDEVPSDDGGFVDVWRLLPQTVYSDFGEFAYNYDATTGDVRVFLDGPLTTDFTQLAPGDTDNQIFRVVILPVDLANDPRLDITDYNSVMNMVGISESDVIKIQ